MIVEANTMNKWLPFLLLCVSACAALSSTLVFSFVYVKLRHELLRVDGASMEPALREGDLVVVQVGIEPREVIAEYATGDVIVFYRQGGPDELVTHRAVEKYVAGEIWYFKTKGDHNPNIDCWRVPENDVIGKITAVNSMPAVIIGTSRFWYAAICGLAISSLVFLAVMTRTHRQIPAMPA